MKKEVIFLVIILNVGFCELQPITNQTNVCLTSTCEEAAREILAGLDNNVDPCNNFYRFACGNTIEKMSIPEDNNFIDMFQIITTKVNEQLRDILSQPTKENETGVASLIITYFQACMNEDYIEKHGEETLRTLLRKLGGWPVLEGNSWKDSNFSWTKLLTTFRELGLDTTYFIEMTVDPDPRNSSKYIIQLDQLIPGLKRDLLLTQNKLKHYFDLMVNISVELGADRIKAQKELNESLELEIKLAKSSLPPEERQDVEKLLNYITIKQLQDKYPKIPWLDYINGLLSPVVQVNENEIVLEVVPSYFSSLEKLVEETPKRVQANYAIWRTIQSILSYLPSTIYRHIQAASQLLDGQSLKPVRWKECTLNIHKQLPILTSSLYARKHFNKAARQNTIEMVKYMKESFRGILKNLEWMEKTTQQKALHKIDKIVDHIGYPEELLNEDQLKNYYRGLELNKNDYLKSFLNITIHETNFKFKKLYSPFNKTDWIRHADVAKVGATYYTSENSIFLPAGILQGTFFNKHRPNYMNFGAIGSVIAHEITHGFDRLGGQYDADGNVVNWWDKQTETRFQNKTQCMIYQYGNYTVSQVNKTINGLRTINENIADNGGIKEAYMAYQEWVKVNGTEPRLPNLDFSPNQLFWISAARNWCAKYKDIYLELVISIDEHSQNEFRVIGPFSNSIEFSTDFKCAPGSKMNPIKKCAVW